MDALQLSDIKQTILTGMKIFETNKAILVREKAMLRMTPLDIIWLGFVKGYVSHAALNRGLSIEELDKTIEELFKKGG